MALKYLIDSLDDVAEHLRPEYTKAAADGKYHLALDGHPVAEYRSKNIELLKEKTELTTRLAAFDGIDPVAAKAALAKTGDDNSEVVALKLKLAEAQSNAAKAATEKDALVLRQTVGAEFLATGGRPEAMDYIVSKAPFTVVNGALKANDGAPPTVEEWLVTQLDASAFAFNPSIGGAALGGKAGVVLGARSNVRQLVNPSPTELGAAAADIKAGKVKVAYTT
jgi:hypothetical protein